MISRCLREDLLVAAEITSDEYAGGKVEEWGRTEPEVESGFIGVMWLDPNSSLQSLRHRYGRRGRVIAKVIGRWTRY